MAHKCLGCKNASTEVPAEVLDESGKNISEELKAMQTDGKKAYKHVHYCPQLKAIVVGGDSPTQQRKECDHYTERT